MYQHLQLRVVIEMRLFFGYGPFQTEWELRGLDVSYAPSSFDLGVSGSLYADRSRSRGCRMRGHLEIAITCVLPPPLRLVAETILRSVAESVPSSVALTSPGIQNSTLPIPESWSQVMQCRFCRGWRRR